MSITHETFLNFNSLQELYDYYRQNGVDESDAKILLKAQEDWHGVAMEAARGIEESPEAFEPVICERDGVSYQIYGVIHGLIGGDDKVYKQFVSDPIAKPDYVIFENGLNYFYKHKSGTVIPDFMVLGVLGSLALGFHVGVFFPRLIWDIVREIIKPANNRGAEDGFIYDPKFHAIDPEIRRGVEPDPPLPSKLQIDYEMTRWDRSGPLGRMIDPFSIVPRSMFMAGFMVGHAKTRGMTEVPTVVGDLHTMEIVRFLEDPDINHPVFKAGESFGEKEGFSRALSFYWAKLIHLFLAGFSGALIIGGLISVILYFTL